MNNAFGIVDWIVVIGYMLVVLLIGAVVSRKQTDTRYFFLAGRSMPAWAVSLSVLATALSAATFIGVPQMAFEGNLTYLITNIGSVIAVFIIAFLFVPPIYREGTVTIYGYLGKRYGAVARGAAGVMFLFGRLLSSGARLFMAGIGFALILYGETNTKELVLAVILLGIIGTTYTIFGGIRAVIWTDVLQITVMVIASLCAVVLLLRAIPVPFDQIVTALQDSDGVNKLHLVDTELSIGKAYTLWSGIFAMIVVGVSTHGVDQDMAQRVMTARSPWQGGLALITSIFIGIPVVFIFMIIGLLLFVFYQRPDLMGSAMPQDIIEDSRRVFPQFVLYHMPVGLRGLTMAGLIAAAMSTFDSAINAMASCLVADVYAPWRRWRSGVVAKDFEESMPDLAASRLAVGIMGFFLTGFAIFAIYLQESGGDQLINFALGVMAFALAPLLGVFCAALFTNRGNALSVYAALATGVVMVLLLQPYMLPKWTGIAVAWPWWWVIVSPLCFIICILGASRSDSSEGCHS
ncbi:MAG: sodium/solute symporter [Candidatus Hydrogenedentes bacterium]|nr:sodium/solute symporter [Candidatus Hydrogenedentota bacterium]